ncbi:MAG: potassium channel family protein [Chitinophagales bacterium]
MASTKRKSFAVIGLGRFGTSVARNLAATGADVLVVDKDERLVNAIAGEVTHAVQADVTDETSVAELGLRNVDVAVVAIGSNIQASILISLMLKEMEVPYVVAKATTELHARVLERMGVDRVVRPEREMGERIANSLTTTNLMDYIAFAPGYSIVEIMAPEQSFGKSLRQRPAGCRRGPMPAGVMAAPGGASPGPGWRTLAG